jgi:hypothetical protein
MNLCVCNSPNSGSGGLLVGSLMRSFGLFKSKEDLDWFIVGWQICVVRTWGCTECVHNHTTMYNVGIALMHFSCGIEWWNQILCRGRGKWWNDAIYGKFCRITEVYKILQILQNLLMRVKIGINFISNGVWQLEWVAFFVKKVSPKPKFFLYFTKCSFEGSSCSSWCCEDQTAK